MTNEMKDVVQAIYELTINPSATPSNWENLAEDVQVAITTKNEKDLLNTLHLNCRFNVAVTEPEPDNIKKSIGSDQGKLVNYKVNS